MSNAIETISLSYRVAGDFDISNVSLTVPTGAVYGFLGPNGAGKTTIIRLLLGFHRPNMGEVLVLDRPVPRDLPAILERTGFVPERPHLYPLLTVAEVIRHHAAFHPRWDDAWAESLFDRFSLPPDRRIARLSKGEVGKLMILLALGQRPELLLLDEPTEGLDPVIRRDIVSVLLEYVADRGATVFIASHLIHELERFCTWIGIMDLGRLVTQMPMEEFKRGIKRLRVAHALDDHQAAPFEILQRETALGAAGEVWLVRGWEASMRSYFDQTGTALKEVIDLDLEEGFVNLLRAFRAELEVGK